MLRLVQLSHPVQGRRVAVVQEPQLRLIHGARSVYELAQAAIKSRRRLADEIHWSTDAPVVYDDAYAGRGQWKILPAFDHPTEAARCLVAGTGLTHNASAASRDAMHAAGHEQSLTDSMRM